MDSTIINPALPFKGTIPNGMYPGRVIVVQGFIPHSSKWFSINLCIGNDIALHISVRFNEVCIVRNHYTCGSWGSEERHPPGLGNLYKGQTFEIMILTEALHYKIAIGGRHFTEFAHRLPFQSVQMIAIDGEVQVRRVEFKMNYSAPSYPVQIGYPTAVCPSGPPATSNHKPIYNPALPLKYRIVGGLHCGNTITVSGKPTITPHRFVINLGCGNGSYSSGKIAFHCNVRFDQFSVVRNSLINGQWGSEERMGGFPFQAGVNFDLVLRIFPNCFEITINGQYFGTFTYRVVPINLVDILEVEGDVNVSSIIIL